MPQTLWVCDRCKASALPTARRYELWVLPTDAPSRTYWLCAACWARVQAVLTNR